MVDLTPVTPLSQRKGIIGVIAGIVVIGGVVFSLYLEYRKTKTASPLPETVAAPPAGSEKDSQRTGGAPSVGIERVQLTPVDFRLPSTFFLEVRNSGFGPGDADLLVDFGPATIDSFEFRPEKMFRLVSGGPRTNAIKGQISGLSEHESFYVYAFITVPRFRDITVNPIGGGLRRRLTIEEFEANERGGFSLPSAFVTFLWIFAAVMICIGGIVFWTWLSTKAEQSSAQEGGESQGG